jgi:plasmid replication initiation protein
MIAKNEIVEFHYTEKNKPIVQSNKLVEARYSLTIEQQRLLLIMISMIEPNDADFKSYKINLKDFSKMLNISPTSIYSRMQGITEDLLKKVVTIKQNNGNLLQLSWISSALYLKGEGAIILRFDPNLSSHLLQLKEQFTTAQLNVGMKFKSVYALRIYLLLKQYVTIKKREFFIKELKELLQITGKSYNKYFNFKNRVLKSAEREINLVSDIKISFEEVKQNRKIEKIIFYIQRQSYQEELFVDSKLKNFVDKKQTMDQKSKLRSLLISLNLSVKYIDNILKKLEDESSLMELSDYVRAGQEYVLEQEKKQNKTINPAPIIKKAIKEGWKSRISSFDNEKKKEIKNIEDPVIKELKNKIKKEFFNDTDFLLTFGYGDFKKIKLDDKKKYNNKEFVFIPKKENTYREIKNKYSNILKKYKIFLKEK